MLTLYLYLMGGYGAASFALAEKDVHTWEYFMQNPRFAIWTALWPVSLPVTRFWPQQMAEWVAAGEGEDK